MYKYEERKRNMIDLKILQQDPRVVISRQLSSPFSSVLLSRTSLCICIASRIVEDLDERGTEKKKWTWMNGGGNAREKEEEEEDDDINNSNDSSR